MLKIGSKFRQWGPNLSPSYPTSQVYSKEFHIQQKQKVVKIHIHKNRHMF